MQYTHGGEEAEKSEIPDIQTFVIDPTKLTLEMQKQIHNKKQLSDTKRSGYKPGRLVPGTQMSFIKNHKNMSNNFYSANATI